MGTINYKSGDIITLGLNLDFEVDGIKELAEEWGCSVEDAEYEEKQFYTDDAKDLTESLLEDINSDIEDCSEIEKWIDIHVEYGYYEGFSVVVNKNYILDKNDLWALEEEDKKEIIKALEVTRTGLKRLTDNYLDVCYPWWSTRFEEGREANYKAIDEAINNAIEEVEEF